MSTTPSGPLPSSARSAVTRYIGAIAVSTTLFDGVWSVEASTGPFLVIDTNSHRPVARLASMMPSASLEGAWAAIPFDGHAHALAWVDRPFCEWLFGREGQGTTISRFILGPVRDGVLSTLPSVIDVWPEPFGPAARPRGRSNPAVIGQGAQMTLFGALDSSAEFANNDKLRFSVNFSLEEDSHHETPGGVVQRVQAHEVPLDAGELPEGAGEARRERGAGGVPREGRAGVPEPPRGAGGPALQEERGELDLPRRARVPREPPAGEAAPHGGAADGDQRGDRGVGNPAPHNLNLQEASGPRERALANISAIEALAAVEAADGRATEEQLTALAAFSGWGGCPDAFSDKPAWKDIADRVRELLSEDEYASARGSVLTAYYTPQPIVDAVWAALADHGIGTAGSPDHVLEPGCGTGNFLARVPASSDVALYGIELDEVSARICAALNPAANVVSGALEDCYVTEDTFDAVIGNVPFSGDISIPYPVAGQTRPIPIHDYFLERSVDAVRSGGLVAVLTSRYTLDKTSDAVRADLARKADLAAVVRLPEGTFSRQAGTDAAVDLIVLRRRPYDAPAPEELPLWVGTVDVGIEADVRENAYLASRPDLVLGDVAVTNGRFGETLSITTKSPADVADALRASLDAQLAPIGNVHDDMGERRHGLPVASVRPDDANTFEYRLGDDGTVWYGTPDAVVPVTFRNDRERNRLVSMVTVAEATRHLHAVEADPSSTDDEVAAAMGELNSRYDTFVERYGHFSDAANSRLYSHEETNWFLLTSLEEVDAHGTFARKAPVFERRTIYPVPPVPDHLEDPDDALNVSLDRTGGVDMALISQLLGTDEERAEELLGDVVVRDPDTDVVLLAEDYLSGNVAAKARHVRELIDIDEFGDARAAAEEWRARSGVAWAHTALLNNDGYGRLVADLGRDWWDQVVDPYGAATASDPEAHLAAARYDSGLNRANTVASATAHLISQLPQGTVLSRVRAPSEREARYLADRSLSAVHAGTVVESDNILWRQATQTAASPSGGYSYRSAAHADLPLISALVSFAVSSDKLSDLDKRVLVGSLFDSDVMYGSRSRVSDCAYARAVARLTGLDDPLGIVDALLDDPSLSEYVAVTASEAFSGAEGATLSSEGWAEYSRERSAFLGARSGDRDVARAARLNSLAERLESAVPVPLTHQEIAAGLGAPWIPPRDVYDFACEVLADPGTSRTLSERRHLSVSFEPLTGQWRVSYSGAGELSPKIQAEFGTERRSPYQLLGDCLNNTLIRVTKDDPSGAVDASGRPRKVTDAAATMAAVSKAGEIRSAWEEWVWADPARTRRLESAYNDRFNSFHAKEVDGSYLTLPDSSADISLADHQKSAVARILRAQEGTLVAHVVGAGKTFDGIAATHEAKRLGRAAKPLIVVPNHIVEQWASDYLKLYPQSHFLVMGKDALRSPDSVRAFWGRAMMGDWDAIIVPESRFSRLHLSRSRRASYLQDRVSEYRTAAIAAAEKSGKDAPTVKALEATAKKAEYALKSLREGKETADERSLQGITWEDIGVDMLVVDEAHHFKNLGVPVASADLGMQVSASAKCEDLLDKCRYMRDEGNGSRIVFETGTPVSNSMSELYNMQRYLAPGLLEAQGISVFASWAASFGTVAPSVELKPDGSGFQVKQRFSKFQNLPELMQAVHQFADVITNADLSLDVPDVDVVPVPVPISPAQRECVQELVARADAIRAGGVAPEDDNMLNVTTDGRKIAIDPKLLLDHAGDPPLEDGKVAACAARVHAIWEAEASRRGTQLVFCDTSTPSGRGWNVYDDLRRRLVDLGVDPAEIAFVHDAGDNVDKREQLFERVRNGEVRVLLGSTAKLGTGTNVQSRLCAIHDLDCPWRPADLEQRLGRIVRQGNSYDRVKAFRYVTEGTFDAYSYQTVERKQRFIAQVITSKSPAREASDLDEVVLDYASLKALATGDPTIQERMRLENDLAQLKLLRSAYASQVASIRHDIECKLEPRARMFRESRDTARDDEAAARRAIEAHGATAPGSWEGIVVEGTLIGDRSAACKALASASAAVQVGTQRTIGAYDGMDVIAVCRSVDTGGGLELPVRYLGVMGAHPHLSGSPVPYGDTRGSGSAVSQLDRVIASIPEDAERFSSALERSESELDQARVAASAPWDRESEYRLARRRYEELVSCGQAPEPDPLAVPTTEETLAALDRAVGSAPTDGRSGPRR